MVHRSLLVHQFTSPLYIHQMNCCCPFRSQEMSAFFICVNHVICLHQSDGLIVCHLPYGPTAYFTLANTVMRHDIPDVAKMSEAYPHLIFNGLSSKLGLRVSLFIFATIILLLFHKLSSLCLKCVHTHSLNFLKSKECFLCIVLKANLSWFWHGYQCFEG